MKKGILLAEAPRGIRFSFDEMECELTHMSNVASFYLKSNPILQLIEDLRNIRYSNMAGAQNWAIRESNPLVTEICPSGYEPGDRKCTFKNVYGTLTFLWEIEVELIGTRKKRKRPDFFFLNGLSSTKLRLFEDSAPDPIPLAQWQFEVGDSVSPGCHFHCGILQTENEPPFPKGLSVPRLPSILVTPMDGLEFLLSELLQHKWVQHASQSQHDIAQWSKIQTERFVKLMEWKIRSVRASTSSAWINLKRAKPTEGDLFA